MSGRVHAVVQDGLGWASLDNPAKRNALSTEMMASLGEILARFDADAGVHAIVIRGSGTEAFAAGADITGLATHADDAGAQQDFDDAVGALFSALHEASTPVIAMIHGYCLGAGLAIALGCDIRLGDERSSFAIPAARLGIGYPVDLTQALVATVGPAHASQILFSGNRIDATNAERIGLVNEVYAVDELEAAAVTLGSMIAGNAPLSIRAAKLAIRSGGDADRAAMARAAVEACRGSADAAEGPRAFREKRPPRFIGR